MNISNIPSFNRVKFVSIDNLSFHYVLILNDLKKTFLGNGSLAVFHLGEFMLESKAAGFKAILS